MTTALTPAFPSATAALQVPTNRPQIRVPEASDLGEPPVTAKHRAARMNAIDDDDDENDSTLAESIATTTIDRQPSAQIGDWQYHLDDAEAVLAMPQFEAIRNALRWAHAYYGDGYLDHDMRLPDDVIAWVLS